MWLSIYICLAHNFQLISLLSLGIERYHFASGDGLQQGKVATNIVERVFDTFQLFVLLCERLHGFPISLLHFLILSHCSERQLTTSGWKRSKLRILVSCWESFLAFGRSLFPFGANLFYFGSKVLLVRVVNNDFFADAEDPAGLTLLDGGQQWSRFGEGNRGIR